MPDAEFVARAHASPKPRAVTSPLDVTFITLEFWTSQTIDLSVASSGETTAESCAVCPTCKDVEPS